MPRGQLSLYHAFEGAMWHIAAVISYAYGFLTNIQGGSSSHFEAKSSDSPGRLDVYAVLDGVGRWPELLGKKFDLCRVNCW